MSGCLLPCVIFVYPMLPAMGNTETTLIFLHKYQHVTVTLNTLVGNFVRRLASHEYNFSELLNLPHLELQRLHILLKHFSSSLSLEVANSF